VIKYIGSKRALLAHILSAVAEAMPSGGTVLDLFSGTARVGHALKGAGYRVVANDHNAYAHTLATCYVQADRERWEAPARAILADLARLPGRAGWFTTTYAEHARYLHPRNAERIEAMREAIAALGPEPELEAVLLTALLEAADRVDSTAGLQMAYMKRWAPRALNDLALRLPALRPRPAAGPCRAMAEEAEDAAAAAVAQGCDLAYLDPPYNQHSYLGNYHLWETLVRWDRPEVYGIACKRVDCRTRRSDFNSRRRIGPALARTVAALDPCPTLVVSFNDEGYLTREALVDMLGRSRHLRVVEIPYGRYVGAKIGIHNPKGEKVGTVGRLTNTEWLFIASRTEDAAEALAEAAAAAAAMPA
jgi:adenine-specific DNA-methyltransferase